MISLRRQTTTTKNQQSNLHRIWQHNKCITELWKRLPDWQSAKCLIHTISLLSAVQMGFHVLSPSRRTPLLSGQFHQKDLQRMQTRKRRVWDVCRLLNKWSIVNHSKRYVVVLQTRNYLDPSVKEKTSVERFYREPLSTEIKKIYFYRPLWRSHMCFTWSCDYASNMWSHMRNTWSCISRNFTWIKVHVWLHIKNMWALVKKVINPQMSKITSDNKSNNYTQNHIQ